MNTSADHQRRALKTELLLEDALAALHEITGIRADVVAREPDLGWGIRPDALIELHVEGTIHRYVVEAKRIDRFAALGQVKHQLGRFPHPGLFIAPRITNEIADKCRELDIQFIDTNGNAFLKGPGLFVLVKGQRPTTVIDTPRGGTATTLKAIFALLCRPDLLNAPYRDIKQAAGIALGAVSAVFLGLDARGYATGGKGNRRIVERQRLIEEWVMHYPTRLRPKLNPKRFHATDPAWWRTVDITAYNALWGGEVAADKLTGHLKPNTVTLYMRPENARGNLTRLVVDQKLRADPRGEIEVLDAFWDFPGDDKFDIVPPLLAYADLLATMDPRDHETARIIHEERLRGPDPKA